MLIKINQWLDNVADYLSTRMSLFVSWYGSKSGIKTRAFLVFGLKILFIACIYYLIFQFREFVYFVAPTSDDGHKFILAVSGIIAFIWAWVRISIAGRKLLKRFRAIKREKVDIPLRLWSYDAVSYIKQTKIAIAYWESLKYLALLNESITNKFFIWTLRSVLEPELELHNQKDFFSIENLPEDFKALHGEKVGKRYVDFGLPLGLLWMLVLFFVPFFAVLWILGVINSLLMFVAGLFGEVFQSIMGNLATLLLVFLVIVLMFSSLGTSFVGVFTALKKRRELWWVPPLSPATPEPQQQEYQELKEHLSRKMDELIIKTEQVNNVDEQLHQRTQAMAKLGKLDPELTGQIGILVNMVLEEEHTKAEISERKRARLDLYKDIIIGTGFFILGIFITSDEVKLFLAKIIVILKSLGT